MQDGADRDHLEVTVDAFQLPNLRCEQPRPHGVIGGFGFELIPSADMNEILSAFPRLKMKQQFTETCRRLVVAKPETSSDNFLRDFGERFVPGYRPTSTVDLLMNAPFED